MRHAIVLGMAKTRKKSKSRPKHRASWRGNLAFGLVSFPVQAINAINREGSDIHFHQLHATCHRRIHYEKVCPVHGEVSNDEIVSGYEYKKNRYVEIDPDELDALRTKSERSFTIDAFVTPESVDPLYFDGRMYYLVPDGAVALEPYTVVADAMEREERVGIGQIVLSGKEQLALVRTIDGMLHMAMLNYDKEVRRPEDLEIPAATARKPRGITRKVQLAQTLIKSWSDDDFDFTDYSDRYREKVKELIDAKVEGREIVAPGEEEETTEVINLMDALKKSVDKVRGHAHKSKPRHRRRRPA
jgi:DNA end-binding protein Ku